MPTVVAFFPQNSRRIHKMLRRSKKLLHQAVATAILQLADALRRTAFLDVSSLNFGGAKSTAVFFVSGRPSAPGTSAGRSKQTRVGLNRGPRLPRRMPLCLAGYATLDATF